MKKFISFNLILLLICIVAIGCQPQNAKDNISMLNLNKVKEISILNSNGFDEKSSTPIVSYTDKETINTLVEVINSATEQEGIVNMVEPNYNLSIIYKDYNKEEFYLWLVEGQIGTLMRVKDNHTIYLLSEEMSYKLYDLIR